jgi:glucose/mannose-6-phosphate isomerase
MITSSDLKNYDSDEMYKIYDQWPEIAKNAYESNYEEAIFNNIDHIVFAGMGGSGAIGDLFSAILSKTNIHVSVVKGYVLPKTVDKNTLVVATSVSGNTIETLTVLDEAKKLNCQLIAFSSGGKMENFCKQNQINFRKIKLIHSPRSSFVIFIYAILKILNLTLPIKKNGIEESLCEIMNLKNKISSSNLSDTNPAIFLANWITGIPLIYYPYGLESAAIRFKSSLQENSKIHVIIEDIIESCHNGIVSWEKPSIVQPILLQGSDDYVKTKERFEIVAQYFEENNIDYQKVLSVSGNILTKLISLIYLLDFVSIYKSVLSKTDPSPVNSINFIKSKI